MYVYLCLHAILFVVCVCVRVCACVLTPASVCVRAYVRLRVQRSEDNMQIPSVLRR